MKRQETKNERLLRELIEAFTARHEHIKIESEMKSDRELLSFTVHPDDYPKVCGGLGRHIQALRTIFEFISHRDKIEITLMLLEVGRGKIAPRTEFVANPKWEPDEIEKLLESLLARIMSGDYEVETFIKGENAMVQIKAAEADGRLLDALIPHLQPIFHAIGKQQGQRVNLVARRGESLLKETESKP